MKKGPSSEQLWPYVLGDLTPDENTDFEHACQENTNLQSELAQARSVLEQLNNMSEAELSQDLTPGIMNLINSPKARDHVPFCFNWSYACKIAACLVLSLSVFYLAHHHASKAVPPAASTPLQVNHAVKLAHNWLVQTQEPTGHWKGTRWEGQQEFSVSLTSLALMALAQTAENEHDPAQMTAIRKATAYLMSQAAFTTSPQKASFRKRYDHALLTAALLDAYRLQASPELHHTLDLALNHMLQQQASSQTWQYTRSDHAPENQPDFLWSCLALQKAVALDWPDLRIRMDAMLALVQQRHTPNHLNDLVCHLTPHAHANRFACTPPVQQRLLDRQVQTGDFAGSWPVEPGPQAAGGRIYSTAINTLMLGPLSAKERPI